GMFRWLASFLLLTLLSPIVSAQTTTLSISSEDLTATPIFNDVDFFTIDIEIDAPLAAGVYSNPDIVQVVYQVTGVLTDPTPSGFSAFDLQRTITGTDFYAQGSSLSFEVDTAAVLSDGVQVAELVGSGVVLEFNGREIGNGRFHPALLQLNADGSGMIQNSNNEPEAGTAIAFGAEYITDLLFDSGNLTVLVETPDEPTLGSSSGGCFIATAAYGSHMAPEVTLLRQFRDTRLLTNRPGRWFVRQYYRYSPAAAEIIADRVLLRSAARAALTPLVYSVKYPAAALALLLASLLVALTRWRRHA
ncbi:MAG: hypothetical protein HKN56_08065, partial [Gammaproteobacteria bacterium]|nr:hypothetical protein [Gammaproteobacteria bacterium]